MRATKMVSYPVIRFAGGWSDVCLERAPSIAPGSPKLYTFDPLTAVDQLVDIG
jgi:hypothetical protein